MMRNGGSIIMNGSITHLKGMPGLGVYAGSKAALRSLARSWAVELAERRIRVDVLSPGPIATHALANAPAEAKEYFRSGIPRKELGRSEEIATVALFLASDDSSFVNGSKICVASPGVDHRANDSAKPGNTACRSRNGAGMVP
jgi:NAD(P)-dependent dehydrogenase (short-subunit alcohol dehydrogenase family)